MVGLPSMSASRGARWARTERDDITTPSRPSGRGRGGFRRRSRQFARTTTIPPSRVVVVVVMRREDMVFNLAAPPPTATPRDPTAAPIPHCRRNEQLRSEPPPRLQNRESLRHAHRRDLHAYRLTRSARLRTTPASLMLFQAASSDPSRSMARHASSMTTAANPNFRASSADHATQ